MENLQDKLENQINNSDHHDLRVIIIHPRTWQYLKDCTDLSLINPNDPKLKYAGIPVFRSSDVSEGEFELF